MSALSPRVDVPRVLRVPDLAVLFGVDVSLIYKWHKRHVLPNPLRVPGDLRWSATTIARWLERDGRA